MFHLQKGRLRADFEEQLGQLRSKLARRDAALESCNSDLVGLADMQVYIGDGKWGRWGERGERGEREIHKGR